MLLPSPMPGPFCARLQRPHVVDDRRFFDLRLMEMT